MTDATVIACAAIIALSILALAMLKGWQDWIAFRSHECEIVRRGAGGPRHGAARIEIADLRERIRHLEAIASGVDL